MDLPEPGLPTSITTSYGRSLVKSVLVLVVAAAALESNLDGADAMASKEVCLGACFELSVIV